jgi:hypothetical protein
MRQWGGHTLVAGQSVLLLVDDKSKRQGVADEIKAELQNGTLTVLEHGSDIGVSNVDAIISYGSKHEDSLLTRSLNVLKPGGYVVFYEPAEGRASSSDEDISDRLMLSGFVGTKISKLGDHVEITSAKPNYEVGTSQKLNLKRAAPANGVSAQDAKNIWTSAAASADNEDLIDEDSLLDESDRTAKPQTKADDCEVGKAGKKACKNCTCGRADTEEGQEAPKPKLTKEMLENPGVGSSCGSCGLGDAYRCAGCPYRGLPTFKVGEKITIPNNFMADDI